MDKPAKVVLQFHKVNDSFWESMANVADEKSITESGEDVYVLLPVKSYSLDDHQFVQIRFNINNGKEVLVWVPRGIVKTIIEGKTDLRGAFSFAGSKIK
jgi:hypothetical protein